MFIRQKTIPLSQTSISLFNLVAAKITLATCTFDNSLSPSFCFIRVLQLAMACNIAVETLPWDHDKLDIQARKGILIMSAAFYKLYTTFVQLVKADLDKN